MIEVRRLADSRIEFGAGNYRVRVRRALVDLELVVGRQTSGRVGRVGRQTLAAPELGPPIAEPNLDSRLAKACDLGQLFSGGHAGIVGFFELLLEHFELFVCEGGSIAAKLGR